MEGRGGEKGRRDREGNEGRSEGGREERRGKEGRGKTVLSFWPLIITFLKRTVVVTKINALISLELDIYPPPQKKTPICI